MALTRRGFLGRLATGVVGACVVAKVPTAWVPEPVRRLAACEYLRTHYNAWTQGRGDIPGCMIVGRDLYEAFEGELVANERFTRNDGWPGPPSLMFKATRVINSNARGWDVRILSREAYGFWRNQSVSA